jgi:glucoamylase
MIGLDEWIAGEARFAAGAMSAAISATHLVKDRPGFGQRDVPRPGSVLASPVPAAYDPDPDYFFHWFRDSAIVIDALRVALAEGFVDSAAIIRFQEFVEFSLSLRSLNGREFLRQGDFRRRVQPSFLRYVRPDAEIAAVFGEAALAESRVNPDGALDFIHWAGPQADGPALRILALLRWRRQKLDLDAALRSGVQELIAGDLAFTLSHAHELSFDIWEEESGRHYYTQLVQAEALAQGAEWLAEIGQSEKARACAGAAAEIAGQLDAFWNGAAGFYRSRAGVASGDAGKELDIAVILAALHAARATGAHSVLDPRAQATLTALEELFEAEYAINRDRPAGRGPAMGRYANDAYYSGGAYFFATLAAAEFYFRLATVLLSGAKMPVTSANWRFRRRLIAVETEVESPSLATAAIERGDGIMRTVQAFTPVGGDLSEQFDGATGAQTSAKHLSWSYAAFITAAASRAQALRANRASDPSAQPAGAA